MFAFPLRMWESLALCRFCSLYTYTLSLCPSCPLFSASQRWLCASSDWFISISLHFMNFQVNMLLLVHFVFIILCLACIYASDTQLQSLYLSGKNVNVPQIRIWANRTKKQNKICTINIDESAIKIQHYKEFSKCNSCVNIDHNMKINNKCSAETATTICIHWMTLEWFTEMNFCHGIF